MLPPGFLAISTNHYIKPENPMSLLDSAASAAKKVGGALLDTYTYPPPSFYFGVTIASTNLAGLARNADARFKEVSGISFEIETDPWKEAGGDYGDIHLPTQMKFSNLKVSRGLVPLASPFADWIFDCLDGADENYIQPETLLISVLNQNGLPLITWSFKDAWPVKWELGTLDSMKNEILMETMEFKYRYFTKLSSAVGAASTAVSSLL